MTKLKTHPWDPAEHITDGEDVIYYLHVISPEGYDPDVTPFILDCIARSKGVTEIAAVEPTGDGSRSVASGLPPSPSPGCEPGRIRQALTPRPSGSGFRLTRLLRRTTTIVYGHVVYTVNGSK